ncbi:MAG: methyltransferase domain-containing protein [Acidimicrobiia bacterium]|nr:methyltransferase domain-containing protein [Acidimicrobiia bacterium]
MPVLREVTTGPVVAVDLAGGYVRQTMSAAPFALGAETDAARLGFRDGSFDLVLASEVIEHLECPEALLDEARRVLRAGGSLVLSTPDPLAIHDLMYRVKRRVRGYDVNEHPGLMLPWVLRRALRARGFEIVEWRTCNFAYPYPVGDVLGKLPGQEALARVTARLERRLQEMPVVGRLGWTQVIVARREASP